MTKLPKTKEITQFLTQNLSTGIGVDFSIQLCDNESINAPASRKVRWGFWRV